MKYIYILLFAMSSFFHYSYAKENTLLHAFFIPTDSVQSNTSIKDIPTPSTAQQPQKRTKKAPLPTTKNSSNIRPKRTFPVEKGKLKKAPLPKKTSKNSYPPKPANINIAPIPQPTPPIPQKHKYTLDDNPDPQIIQTTTTVVETKPVQEISPLEQLKNSSISELLSTIPYPQFTTPSYSQIYENYVMDLRTLYRNQKLITNIKLEQSLEKAKTMQRFEVPLD